MAALDVLILDDPDSRHARLVQDALTARGAASQRLNCADLGEWLIDIRPGGMLLRSNAAKWRVSTSTTVWYRRLGSPVVDDFDPDEAQLIRDEMPHILLGGLVACGVRWVDEPFDVERAERKLFQLSTATRMRLAVPSSVVTNDPIMAAQAVDKTRVVAKPLSPGQGIVPHVDEVHADDVVEFDGSPVLLQELVTGATADLRVVVIGSRAWTWRRPRTPQTIDWRAEDPSGFGFGRVSRHTVELGAIDLTRALGLTMSVQDWLETPDGVVALETNPQGAWAFLDSASEYIPDAVAAHLSEQSGETLVSGAWPKPFKRVLWDLGRARKAPENDGATAPQFAPPAWATVSARSSEALSVVFRANDEAKLGAKAAEDKAARLVRAALATLAVATALLGYQLQFALEYGLVWLSLLAFVVGAFAFLTIAAFEATEIDRVGFYRHAGGQDLARPGPRDSIAAVIEQEETGRRLATWSSRHKHSALMQARAWFTRGLTFLLAAAITAAISWAIDASDSNVPPLPTEESDETSYPVTEVSDPTRATSD